MAERWTRAGLSAHVEGLARRKKGDAFVFEIAGLAKTLDEADRTLLEEILMQRAKPDETGAAGMRRRTEKLGWFRRALSRGEERAAALVRRRGG
jgi:hypothetical protein